MSDRGSLFRSSYRIGEVLAVRRVWLAAESRRPPVIDRTPTSTDCKYAFHLAFDKLSGNAITPEKSRGDGSVV
jgi:hypothetical protein